MRIWAGKEPHKPNWGGKFIPAYWVEWIREAEFGWGAVCGAAAAVITAKILDILWATFT